MSNWCEWLGQFWIMGFLSQVVVALTSYAFDQWAFWQNLPSKLKAVTWGTLCVGLSIGAWGIGTALTCPDLPAPSQVLFIGFMAALSFFSGGYGHEKRK